MVVRVTPHAAPIGIPIAAPGELSISFEAMRRSTGRTFLAEEYAVVVTGSAVGANFNATTETFMTYSGGGVPTTARGGTTQIYGAATVLPVMDLTDLSKSIGTVGAMAWDTPGTDKMIIAETYAIIGGVLKKATATLVRTIDDTFTVAAEKVLLVSPTSNFGSPPVGTQTFTTMALARAAFTDGDVILLERNVTHIGGGSFNPNNEASVTIGTYVPGDLSDRSSRATLVRSGTSGNIIYIPQVGSPSGSSFVIQNIDLSGPYNALDGTGDFVNGIEAFGYDFLTANNCTFNGLRSGLEVQGDAGTLGAWCCHGTNWQNYGLLFGRTKHVVVRGSTASQPIGTIGDDGKGTGDPLPDHAAFRWTAIATFARYLMDLCNLETNNGWSTATLVDGTLQGAEQPNGRFMFSGRQGGVEDCTGHSGAITRNHFTNGFNSVHCKVAVNGDDAYPGDILIAYNYMRLDGWGVGGLITSYGGTVVRGNCLYMPAVEAVFGENRMQYAFQMSDGNQVDQGDNGTRDCYVFDNTIVNDQSVSQMTNVNGQRRFDVVAPLSEFTTHEANNVVSVPGALNGADFDFLPLSTDMRPTTGSNAIAGHLGALRSLFDAQGNSKPVTGGDQGWLNTA